MIKKILIANRGEICCRIIKTAKRMGISTVAVYSEADQHALHVKMADEAVYLGPSPSKQSYLCGDIIIQLAKQLGVDAIHPGYGFLSENAEFAQLCAKNSLIFIGPSIDAIKAMGSKSAAKKLMQQANVPLVPGYHGDEQSLAILQSHADAMGYPVLLKAAAGGGGKGMREVWQANDFSAALDAAKREALSSFNDDVMLVEKYLTQPRHIEIQVFCDQQGHAVYLFERDCSIQRRHQKVIEEAPAPRVTNVLRQEMGEAALAAAKAINYVGAGTVEFLLDTDGQFYFMEMNTRLQVEHPVTEMISGQDLVEWQIRVANNEPLPLSQDQLSINGHAFEARIYAEEPMNDFLPSTGRISMLQTPAESKHVRIDSGVAEGDVISVYYDPMLAKLIVWDENREKALIRFRQALAEFRVVGVETNLNFLSKLSNIKEFQQSEIDTGFIDKHKKQLFLQNQPMIEQIIPLAALLVMLKRQPIVLADTHDSRSPWAQLNSWRTNTLHHECMALLIENETYRVELTQLISPDQNVFDITFQDQHYLASGSIRNQQLVSKINGHNTIVSFGTHKQGYALCLATNTVHFEVASSDLGLNQQSAHPHDYTAPMNGTVVAILVQPKQRVETGQNLVVIEAMKMEHAIKASSAGEVSEFYVDVGDLVNGGEQILVFDCDK